MNRSRGGLREPAAFALTVTAVLGFSCVMAVLLHNPAAAARSQDATGVELYETHCAGCHQSDGAGISGTFPPLAGNAAAADSAYVVSVIVDGRSGPIEVNGVAYDTEMPPVTALSTDADIEAVAAYVVELSGVSPEPAAEPADVEPPAAGDIDRGHDLFVGSERLDAGGAACAACHTAGSVGNLGGSSLGPDLTDTFTTFGGEAGLTAWLANPPSQTMQPIFTDAPMNEAEIADLVAFMADAPSQDKPADDVDILLLAGIAGLIVLVAGMAVAWRGMRQSYVERLRRKPSPRRTNLQPVTSPDVPQPRPESSSADTPRSGR